MLRRRLLVLVLLWQPVFAADPAIEVVVRPVEWPTEAERAAEQAEHLGEHDLAVWLGEGEARFLAVRREALVAPALGTVVLVRARALGANAADRLGYLHEALPPVGWNTLVLDLPNVPDTPVPTRDRVRSAPVPNELRTGRSASTHDGATDAKGNQTQAATTVAGSAVNAVAADRDRILGRLGAVVNEAARAGTAVIMIGEGEAATWVARANGQTPLAAAVVALNIDDPATPLDGKPASDWVRSLTVPTLLMQEAPRSWSPDDRLPASVELLLLPASHPAGEERLVRQVRGWMKRRQIG